MANVVQIVLKALDQTKQGFTGPIKNLSDLGKRIDQVTPALAAMAATAATAFGVMSNHAINAADEMNKLSQKAGTTVETFSSLAYSANLSGLENEKLAKGFKELSKNLVDARAVGSPMANMFESIGVNIRGANGELLTADQVLLNISDRFADTADGANKVAAASKLFGDKLGQDMIPFLNQGSKAIKDLQTEAKDLGQVFSTEAAQSAEQFNDNLTKMKAAFQGIANEVVSQLLPTMVKLTEEFVKWIRETGVIAGTANTIVDVFKVFDFVIQSVLNTFQALWKAFETLGKIIGASASSWVDYWNLVLQLAKSGSQIMFDVMTGQYLKAASAVDSALDGIQQRFDQLKSGIIQSGTEAVKGFTAAWEQLGKGPAIQDMIGSLNATGGAHGSGSESNPINVNKPNLPFTSTGSTGDLLPSGYTMEAYHLDQQMQIATKQAMLDAFGTKMTVSAQSKAMLDIQMAQEEMRYQERMKQISDLALAETENFPQIENAMREHAARVKAIHADIGKSVRQSYSTMVDSTASILGSFAQIAQAHGKKSFGMWQALSYGQAVISTLAGATRAFAEHPWPASAFIAAAVTAAGFANVAQIAATKPPQAHAGASYIPEESTYLLQRGERVLAPEQNQDLTAFMANGGGPSEISVYLDGEILARGIGNLSRNGRLEIAARSIV